MNSVLYFSTHGTIYETRAYTQADIADLVRDRALHCLTSSDKQFDFWFAPAAARCQRRVNRAAVELLLATTDFTAKDVPLLRGCVVLATHDSDGDVDGLSWQQLDVVREKMQSLSPRDERVLARRIAREDNRVPRPATPAARPAATAA